MAEGVAEARRERELSKQALAARVAALRTELDPRQRLRRDGLRYAVIGAAAMVAALAVVLIRSRRRQRPPDQPAVTSLEDVARQLAEIRAEMGKRRKDSKPLWQTLAMRGASAAGTGVGTAITRRMVERMTPDGPAESDRPEAPTARS